MNYLSVCSGVEAATVAWHPLGWQAVAYSEIEKFPSQVLKHHYPQTPNYGDMTKYKEWPNANVDVLVGGTPCQSFSVAGLRKGLDDPRGNLMLTYLAIAKRYSPKWLVWENVPGVLSSNSGQDFAALLRGMAELGYGFAFRVLDAQYFGVAQRRRRVFVIGCAGDWRSAAAVLFEQESMSGDPAPSRKARHSAAAGDYDCVNTLCARDYKGIDARDLSKAIPVAFKMCGGCEGGGKGYLGQDECAFTLSTSQDQQIFNRMAVRKLTPTEYERLQGFPDGYTNINEKTADGPRYKALGNSMAVPVMRWLGERIEMVDKIKKDKNE